MKWVGKLLAGCAISLMVAAPVSALEVGDKAPRLEIEEWVKGDAIDLAKTGGKITVVEFWATWCGPCKISMPHLTELQTRFQPAGVVFVGVSSEDIRTVQSFVSRQGSGMAYTVAVDPSGKTRIAYGVRGIPTAFVVGGDGVIAWAGHSMHPGLEKTLEEMTAGSYDPKEAATRFRLIKSYRSVMRKEDYRKALPLIDEMIKLDPRGRNQYEADRFHCMAMNIRTSREAKAVADGVIAKIDDARVLATMAWRMMDQEEGYRGQYDAVALRSAEKAHGLLAGDMDVLRTLAYARYLNGNVASAIELQKQAIELATPEMKPELQADLDFFAEDVP